MKFHCWTWLLASGQGGNRPFSGAKDRPFTSHIYVLWACLLKLVGCAGPRKTRQAPGQPAAMYHLTNALPALPKEASRALKKGLICVLATLAHGALAAWLVRLWTLSLWVSVSTGYAPGPCSESGTSHVCVMSKSKSWVTGESGTDSQPGSRFCRKVV